jgi:hypothetical protein
MLPGAWPQSRRVGGPVTPSNRDPTLEADFVNMATANGWRLVDTLRFALSKMMVPAMAGTPSGLRRSMSVSARLWRVEGQTDSPTSGPHLFPFPEPPSGFIILIARLTALPSINGASPANLAYTFFDSLFLPFSLGTYP